MPFSRPTLSELVTRTLQDAQSRLDADQLRRNDADVLARTLAGASHELHGHLAFIAAQIIYDTAETEYLDRWADIWLTVPRKAATPAIGNVTITGTNGVTIPSGSVLVRADGVEYTTDADVTIASSTAVASVTASVAGQSGNTIAATALSLSSPIAGVNSTVVVAIGGLVSGTDIEDDASLRGRLIARIQAPPHGGSKADYETWALEVPGVTRVWVSPQELGPGNVTVRFVRDDDASIIPDSTEVSAVQSYIDERRPVTAIVSVVAPVAVPLNFTISVTPNNSTVKAAVEAELKDLIAREASPGGTILLSHIREAISIAAGETNYTMTVPSADVTNTTGNISTMGVITWV